MIDIEYIGFCKGNLMDGNCMQCLSHYYISKEQWEIYYLYNAIPIQVRDLLQNRGSFQNPNHFRGSPVSTITTSSALVTELSFSSAVLVATGTSIV